MTCNDDRDRSDHAADPDSGWAKSTFSGAAGCCVEVLIGDADIQVRDSKFRRASPESGSGPILTFTRAEWTAFIAGVKDGQFD